jgi:two-component system, OmpR family, phosphate regulon sensor histidine kinase PhoR
MKTTGIKSSIYTISLILIGIIVLPLIFYSVFEISMLNKNEQMISQIYTQQLDAILFSVNQYLWDNLSGWQSRLNRIQDTAAPVESGIRNMVDEIPPLQMVAFSDSLLSRWSFFVKSDTVVNKDLFKRTIMDSLRSKSGLLARMDKYSRARYRKIEIVQFADSAGGADEKLILLYLSDSKVPDQRIVYFLVDINVFIEQVLAPKIEEIAGDQFIVGVFSLPRQHLLYQNATVQISDLKQIRSLWVLPDYQLGIQLRGESIEDLARNRFKINMVLILGVDLILLLGAWIVFRMIRQQIRLAQMKSDFVSNVSHELRTPLALIRMYAETLEMGRIVDEPKRQEYYRIIGQETERLTRLINNILNFSRIESDRKEYHFRETDLNRIIQKLLATYSFHIESKGFHLTTDLDPALPKVQADDEAVTEAILNLLDNALKYSERDKYIAIRSRQREREVLVQVEDHGIGIDAVHTRFIFEKFYRVSNSLVHDTKGSGLGLTLVKHIMESHRGRVELASTPGKGSCFSLIFPVGK